MSEENPTNAPTWSEGEPVDSMSGDDAKAEIKSIESDPSFAGDGKMDYWSRQNMLKRRDSLYRHAYPENVDKPYSGMEDTLKQQGIDQEFLGSEQERFAERDDEEAIKKAQNELTSYFGSEEDAEKALARAKDLFHRFAGPDDLAFIEDSGLANNAEFIKKLAEIAVMLNPEKEI